MLELYKEKRKKYVYCENLVNPLYSKVIHAFHRNQALWIYYDLNDSTLKLGSGFIDLTTAQPSAAIKKLRINII
jgi:hypothetical protein